MKDGFKFFLLAGGRREEIINLRWCDIYEYNDIKFFMFGNLKVERITKKKCTPPKFVPINDDLYDLLIEMGYHEKKNTQDYILFPDRNIKSKTIMELISKGFTHYKKGAGITKNIKLKTLRKTYTSLGFIKSWEIRQDY